MCTYYNSYHRHYYYYYYLFFSSFSHQCLPIVSHRSLSDSKSPQFSRTLLSILADLNNVVVWMVATRPLISKSTSPCTSPLVTLPRTLITIGITVTFKFHSFFISLARSWYLFLFSLSFDYTQWPAGTAKSTTRQVLFSFCWLLRILVIRLYFKSLEEFVHLVLQGRFWVV